MGGGHSGRPTKKRKNKFTEKNLFFFSDPATRGGGGKNKDLTTKRKSSEKIPKTFFPKSGLEKVKS